MKTEFVDVNATRKTVRVEIPTDVVDAEIDRIARDYSRKARVPGFRPGKTPPRVIKQRFKDQILHDVAHDLIPRAVDDALREKGLEAVDTPDVRDVNDRGRPAAHLHRVVRHRAGVRSGRPLDHRVHARLERDQRRSGPDRRCSGCAIARALRAGRRARRRSRRHGRRSISSGATRAARPTRTPTSASSSAPKRTRRASTSSCSASRSAPTKEFTLHYPADYPIGELANTDVSYTVTVKGLKRRVRAGARRRVREGSREFDTLDALTTRVREDLEHEAKHAAEREDRSELMKQLADAAAVRGAGVDDRARGRSSSRGVRAAADRPEHRSAAGRASTGTRSARASARCRARRWRRRWCSTR